MRTETYLCVIIDRTTRKELASKEVVLDNLAYQDEYNARHIARRWFETTYRYLADKYDWCVDSVLLSTTE